MTEQISPESIFSRVNELNKDASQAGYYLNPDRFFTDGLVEGLIINKMRYGYESCPCRLSLGHEEDDRDIICPCDYRDEDLDEYGACYCGLYVSQEIAQKNLPVPVVPERRGVSKRNQNQKTSVFQGGSLTYPVFRCKVCGYLCARNSPPEICPICKAGKERFEQFI